MANPFSDLYLVHPGYGTFAPSDEKAFQLAACPNCGGTQMSVVGYSSNGGQTWLRCANCSLGIVRNGEAYSPAPKPLTVPLGVEGDELSAWGEVRECLAVGAFTAAVMMCRKLLFHVAVAHGLPPKNEKGFAPNFSQAVQQLVDEGVITKHMRPWVDRIKSVGNDANHEIPSVTREQALDIALFTEQLLKLAYEMPALVEKGADAALQAEPLAE